MVAGHLQEKNGIYYMVLSYPSANGKRKNKWISTKLPVKGNKKKAEKLLSEIRQTFVPVEKPMDAEINFSDYMLQWLQIVKPTVATTTYASYSSIVQKIVVPYFEKKAIPLAELKAIDIQAFYLKHLERVSARTVIHYHTLLHRALKYAVKIELIDANPVDKVDRPKAAPFVGSFYDSAEVQKLFKAAKRSKLEIPIFLGAFYGLRRSEAIGLKWDAIDFQNDTITIRHTVVSCYIDGKQVQKAQDITKTKSSMRTLPLIPAFKELLQHKKQQQNEFQRMCGKSYNKDYLGYICVDEMGKLLSPHYLTEAFAKLLKKHGLRKIRYHDLRHPYVKPTTKIFSLRLMDFQAQAYPDAQRKNHGACQLHQGEQSRSSVRPLCNRKQFPCRQPQSKISRILYAISMRLSGYTSTRSISSSASSVVSVSVSKITLDASLRLSCRACSSCFFFACANTAA